MLLAGLICSLACIAAVTLLRQQRGEDRHIDQRWQMAAGITTGFGIWATHFVAMLGYNGGIVLNYALGLTLLSLAVAIVTICSGFALASRPVKSSRQLIGGGLAVGTGITAMHYLGMQAVEIPARFVWSPGLIALSFLLAIAFAVPALALALRRKGWPAGICAGLLLMLAILSLHFTGMAALSILPDAEYDASPFGLAPMALGIVIGAFALAVLIIGAGAAILNTAAVMLIDARGREFRILVEGITDCALYMLDGDGHVASWNAGAARLKGFHASEAIGLHFSTFYSEEDRAAGLPTWALGQARATGKFVAEGWRYRKDRSRFWASVTIETVIDEFGSIIGFAKITRDISRQKEDQDALLALTAKLDAALTNMYQGLVLYDAEGRVALVNARFRQMYGLSPEIQLEGLTIEDFMRTSLFARNGVPVSDERIATGLEWMRACLDEENGSTVQISFDDGAVVEVSYRGLPEGGIVATFEDVSERHRSEARIAHMALHDDLTGLPNRANFNDHLDVVLERSADEQMRVGVVIIDLDGFKEINDTQGHGVGDHVLQALSERFSDALGQGEMVARVGGDEFAAYCIFESDDELVGFTDRLAAVFQPAIVHDHLEIRLGASIGVAVHPDDGEDRELILNNADLAMYRAKGRHGLQVCRYEYGMDESARIRRTMAKDLRGAVARDELRVAFQVQQSVETREITGYEALLRWEHSTQGWISPEQFVPVAEESGSIVEIGEWVLRRACEAAMQWPQPWRVAVNLSPVQFINRDLPATLHEILLETGLPPARLELEITETAIIADKASALHMLRQIKALGVTIAIDDFGTGYSSLETLNSFPFDKIKIDRSFVARSDRSAQARAIIRAVIALARSLDMPVLAEGVETEAQLEFLRNEGLCEAQGYLLGRPGFEVTEQATASAA